MTFPLFEKLEDVPDQTEMVTKKVKAGEGWQDVVSTQFNIVELLGHYSEYLWHFAPNVKHFNSHDQYVSAIKEYLKKKYPEAWDKETTKDSYSKLRGNYEKLFIKDWILFGLCGMLENITTTHQHTKIFVEKLPNAQKW